MERVVLRAHLFRVMKNKELRKECTRTNLKVKQKSKAEFHTDMFRHI